MFSKRLIEFSSDVSDWLEHPVPAKKVVPTWYKEMKNYTDKLNLLNPTIKKCVPVLDSLTSGYIILNPVETVFWQEGDRILWEYPEAISNVVLEKGCGIEYHTMKQISKAFVRDNEYLQPFKYLNPWRIKTPKNYSCLFTNPFNRDDDGIRLIDGIVDTDTYPNTINFPFFLKKMKKHESFILKKNYPVALVFPFLRDEWKMKVKKNDIFDREKNSKAFFKTFTILKDNYKKIFWSKKNYD